MNPASILLLPAPEHRETLLGDSPGNGRAPFAFVLPGLTPHLISQLMDNPSLGSTVALVLRWNERDDEMGCDRVRRALAQPLPNDERIGIYHWRFGPEELANLARAAALGRVIYLDLDGREVSP